ncbi:MAG: decaprenylphospho-beta-D-erythro-pentofuranosid-2-ulose 2-reductase [Candidatus Dormibacteraeota bacterium]|nr:decaprenylphospho-beta-D-erythro-pentofuranosid-2-ulose 2-reductase [Candidatus Dormibacteraeota bacterium]
MPIESVLVLGGTSEIGESTAAELIRHGARTILLAGRDLDALEPVAERLRAVGANRVELIPFDAVATGTHDDIVRRAFSEFGDIDLALIAFGVLGDQAEAGQSAAVALDIVATNFEGAVSVAIPLVRELRGQGHGHIAVLSSVAAERPRRANYVYGSSKAGLDAFFQGLADSLAGTGIHVMVVRPGFVRTKMTASTPPAPMATTPDAVARAIWQGLEQGAGTVWVPGKLRWVMSGLRHLPRPVFRRIT